MMRIGMSNKHLYEVRTIKNNTYMALLPTGKIDASGKIINELSSSILKGDQLSVDFDIKIGFQYADNLATYKDMIKELKLIVRPNIVGYTKLREALEEKRKYVTYVSNCKRQGIEVSKPMPADYDELASMYEKASLYIEAQQFQLSDIPKRQEAGRRAIKILFEGSYAEIAKSILDNWSTTSDF